jgi:hypothetical protein
MGLCGWFIYNQTTERVVSLRVLAQAVASAGSVIGQIAR